MYTIEHVTTFEQFSGLRGVWNEVVARCGNATPFMTFEWMSCCLQALGRSDGLLVLLVKDRGEIVAIAPFQRTRKRMAGMPLNALAFIGEEYTVRKQLILARQDPLIADAVLEHLYALGGWETLSLDMVPVQSETAEAIRRRAGTGGMRCVEVPREFSPYIPVESSWDEYLRGRSQNFRHKLNRTRNLYERGGDYEVAVYRREDIGRAIEEMELIGQRSWKRELRGAAQAGAPAEKQPLHRTLAAAFAPKGWLAIWVLRLKGRPIAYALNLEYGERTYAVWIEFDEDFDRLSPSEFLNTHAIRDCFERGGKEYDWMGPRLPFKMRWTSACREHRKYIVFNRTPRATAFYVARKLLVENLNRVLRRGGGAEAPSTGRAGIIAGRREKTYGAGQR